MEKRWLLCLVCLVMVVCLLLAVPWVCLRFVIVIFPDHTHLLFLCNDSCDCVAWLLLKVSPYLHLISLLLL